MEGLEKELEVTWVITLWPSPASSGNVCCFKLSGPRTFQDWHWCHSSLAVESAMKFSSSLKFNAVAEWWDEYIAYDALKKYIYHLEKAQHEQGQGTYRDAEESHANERTALVDRTAATDAVFVPLLDRELKKICAFYAAQEKQLVDDVAELEELVAQQDQVGMTGDHYEDGPSLEDDDDDDDSLSHSPAPNRRRRALATVYVWYVPVPFRRIISSISSDGQADHSHSPVSPTGPVSTLGRLANKLTPDFMRSSITSAMGDNVWTSKSDYATDTRLLFKRRITTLYISVTSLRSYAEVNHSGFRKILKKCLKDTYLHTAVEPAQPFTPSARSTLTGLANRLVDLYTKCVTRGDRGLAKQQLRLHQRENIAWERDTVWRQMIGRERRGDGGTFAGAVLLEDEDTLGPADSQNPKPGWVITLGPRTRIRVTRKKIALLGAIAVFVALLNHQTVQGTEANRCYAILMFCTVLWATEVPSRYSSPRSWYPLLLVVFGVIRNDQGEPLKKPDATKYVFSIMFSPTIMLLIGGFTISSALSKTAIDRVLITRVLALAGTRPSTVLLAFMGVSCFASMWISNVAAPTLCFTLIRPILRTLPPKSQFGPCLILAIALAANIGGQSSPISSPQNLIALDAMDPPISWGSWFIVALPVSIVSILLIWGLLLVSYRPARAPDGGPDIEIKLIRPTKEPFTWKQYWVAFVCIGTIALWCVARNVQDYLGDMGVIALIPIVAFFATGVLKKDDFEQFAWTIVFLAMGGIALGKGVTSSGLLEVLDVLIRDLLEGVSLYNVVLILSPVVLVISTFISHTIASVLLVPIAKEVGSNLAGNHANLLIFITGLICSTGMGMPVSGFPNQTAAQQEDELGQLYLTNVDFLKNGVPASVIATLVVATIGFLLMKAIGYVFLVFSFLSYPRLADALVPRM
ncbi:SPX domain-containing protein [Mycena amicta]|nr:SPX domain-containing protein [Mycena amicta]